jgi:hypothetical protein
MLMNHRTRVSVSKTRKMYHKILLRQTPKRAYPDIPYDITHFNRVRSFDGQTFSTDLEEGIKTHATPDLHLLQK